MASQQDIDVTRSEAPLESDLIDELVSFWETAFECSFVWACEVLAGAESECNRETVFVAMAGDEMAGTCRLSVSQADPRLGLVGEVVTNPKFRGKGIARDLCERAAREFRDNGGEALFLATGNPSAECIYSALGWRKMAGSNVMLNPVRGSNCEEFLVDYFKLGRDLPVRILRGSSRHRVTMVPLIITPHDSDLLDANAGIRSVRYAKQLSCEGLYMRYAGIDGVWFAAERADGAAVGLSSASITDGDACRIDAFAHPYHTNCLNDLYKACIDWAKASRASSVYLSCPKSDVYKKAFVSKIECLADVEIRVETPNWFTGQENCS